MISLNDKKKMQESLNLFGYCKVPLSLSQRECEEVIKFINNSSSAADQYYGGSEIRNWGLEKKMPIIADLSNTLDDFLKNIFPGAEKCRTVLGIRNESVSPEEFRSGRWHIDSYRRQFKFFCFLRPVNENNGPFAIIEGTHSAWFKMRMAFRGIYLTISDLASGKRKYQKIDDDFIKSLVDAGYKPKTFFSDTGEIFLVNTSMIHRATPCNSGTRYALTLYYPPF